MFKRLKNLWKLSEFELDFDDDGVSRRTHPIFKSSFAAKKGRLATIADFNKQENPLEENLN